VPFSSKHLRERHGEKAESDSMITEMAKMNGHTPASAERHVRFAGGRIA